MMPLGRAYGDDSIIGKATTLSKEADSPFLKGLNIPGLRTFDDRGDLVWYDYFDESILHWDDISTGDASISISSEYAHTGSGSLKLFCPSSSARAIASKGFYGITEGLVGAEVRFSFDDPSQASQFGLDAQFYIDGMPCAVDVFANIGTQKVMYTTEGYDGVVVDSWNTRSNPREWHALKVVWDIGAGVFERIMFDDTYVNLRGVKVLVGPLPPVNPVEGMLSVRLVAYTTGGADANVYVDRFILTKNEPYNW